MTYANKTLRNEYMGKAQDIGSGAIRLVSDFFSNGIADTIEKPIGDFICVGTYDWTLTDLDRALYEMQKQNLGKAEKFVMTFLENEFINSSGAFERALKNKKEWKGLKS